MTMASIPLSALNIHLETLGLAFTSFLIVTLYQAYLNFFGDSPW